MPQPSPLPPDPEPTLHGLAGQLGIVARAVHRIEKQHERFEDHVADLRLTGAQLRKTAATLATAAVRLQPVSMRARVLALVLGGIAGGALVQVLRLALVG